jgi:hypothetical protein
MATAPQITDAGVPVATTAKKVNPNVGKGLSGKIPSNQSGGCQQSSGGLLSDIPGFKQIGDASYYLCVLTAESTWLRIAEVVGGLIIVGLGLHSILSDTAPVQAAKSATKKTVGLGLSVAAPEARAARTVRKASTEAKVHHAKGLALSKKTTGSYSGASQRAAAMSKAGKASSTAARASGSSVHTSLKSKSNGNGSRAAAIAALRERGNKLAPQVKSGDYWEVAQ